MRDSVNFTLSENEEANVKYTINDRINDLQYKSMYEGPLTEKEQDELHLLTITNDVLYCSIASEVRREMADSHSAHPSENIRMSTFNRYYGLIKGFDSYDCKKLTPEENIHNLFKVALSDDVPHFDARGNSYSFLDKDYVNNPLYSARQRADTALVLLELKQRCGFADDEIFNIPQLRPLPKLPEIDNTEFHHDGKRRQVEGPDVS